MSKVSEKELAKFSRNYAGDSSVCDRFMDYIGGRIVSTRQSRLDLESLWLEDLKMWSCKLDEQGYQGRSNLFIPELNHQVETSSEKIVSAIFPSTDYINAIPLKGIDEEQAEKIKAAVFYELEVKNKLSALHWSFARNKVLFGNGIYKVGYEKEFVEIYIRDKKGKAKKVQVPKWHGVKLSVVDNFRFYVYPELKDISEAELIFEDQLYNLRKAKQETKLWKNLEQVGEIAHDIDHQWVDSTKLEFMRLSNVIKYFKDHALFTTVFCNFDLVKDDHVPVMAVIANNKQVVRLIRNPFWFQTPPYLSSKYNSRPGDPFYGLSLADKLRTQQGMMNDLANQTMDSLNFIVNPIAIIDPGLAGDINSMKVMPGARWLGSPEGIQFSQFPDVSGSGFRGMQEIRGQIAQFSDNTPGIAPQLQGKARSATQANLVSQAVSSKQRAMGKLEESEVLAPMCKMTHILLQQFQEEAYQIRIQGPDKGQWIVKNVQPEDLVGDVDFVWRGISEEERNAVRSQQLLAAYNMALQTATVMPGEVDLPEFFKLIMKEAFDIKDIDFLFNSLKQKKTVDAEIENIALEQGQDVVTNPGDNDEEHSKIHKALLDRDLSDEATIALLRHLERHKLQGQAKAELEQMKSRVDALQAVQGMTGGPQGQGGPAVPSPMEGNQSQVASSPQGMFSSAQASNNLMEMG